MIRKLNKSDYGTEGIADFPLINQELYVLIGENVKIEYAERCIHHLQSLPSDVVETLLSGTIKYCEDFREHFADDGITIPENMIANEVLPYIHAGGIYIMGTPKDENIPVFTLSLNCDWEQEHGMEWAIQGNKVIYIGAFNGGFSPWEEEYTDDIAGSYV